MNSTESNELSELGYALISEADVDVLDHFNSDFFVELVFPKDFERSVALLLELVNRISEEQSFEVRSSNLTQKMNESIDFINLHSGSTLHGFVMDEDDIDG